MYYLCRTVLAAAIIWVIPSLASASSLFINTPDRAFIRVDFRQSSGLKLVLGKPAYGLFFKADWNPWFSPQAVQDAGQVFEPGHRGGALYFNDRCRFTASVGSSTLLFDTALDEAWTTESLSNYRR